MGVGFNGCASPYSEHRLLQLEPELSEAIQFLDSPNACRAALRAIGSRDNLFRSAAAEALREIDEFRVEQWWNERSLCFEIVTNLNDAERMLSQMKERFGGMDVAVIEAEEVVREIKLRED